MSGRVDATAEAADAEPPTRPPAPTGRSASAMVAAGILLSRIFGLVRERVFAHYFGATLFADAFRAGFRIPNLIQNLLGEGTLSASFIPVYAELLERGETEEAGRVAGAVFALLAAIAGVLALLGILFAPLVVKVLLPGFDPVREALTIRTVRILFPMTALSVLGAWSLGILNSHRHFFISYVSPVIWNAAMIAAMYLFGGRVGMERLLLALCWGALLGGALQFAVQLPWVWRLERGLKVRWDTHIAGVREVVRNATPAMLGRGVVQFSAYVDFMLASLLAAGGVATIGYALTLYMLPISLFGMSVAAAELPELARQRASGTELLRERTNAGLERIAFYVMPSFVAYLLLGDVIVAALFQTGRFGPNDTRLVYLTLAGFSVSLLATTGSRLFSSTYFALRDTKTPARFAALRVLNSAVFGFVLMLVFEPVTIFGLRIGPWGLGHLHAGELRFGAVGLALGAGIAAWIEWWNLRQTLRRRIGHVGAGSGPLTRMLAAALAGAAVGWGIRLLLPPIHPILTAVLVCGGFGGVYLGIAALLGLREVRGLARRLGLGRSGPK